MEIKDLFLLNNNNARQRAAESHNISVRSAAFHGLFSPMLEWNISSHLNFPEIQGKKEVKEDISQRVILNCANHIIAEQLVFEWQTNLCSSAEACFWSQLTTLVEVNLGRTLKSSLTFNLDF